VGLVSAVFNVAFTLDRIPPPAPVLDAAPSSTNIRTLAVGGSKEADASVWLNGQQILASDSTTHWTYAVSLAVGPNTLSFTQRDRAGNQSPANVLAVLFDDTAPAPVSLSANPDGNGTQVALDWSGYEDTRGYEDTHCRSHRRSPFARGLPATDWGVSLTDAESLPAIWAL
jgi:hypothetical protein